MGDISSILVDGSWRATKSSREVVNPSTGKALWAQSAASKDEVRDAVEAVPGFRSTETRPNKVWRPTVSDGERVDAPIGSGIRKEV
ncbi:MAG: hypothetical protein GEU78_15395 [Actinobacteria bacterium]|nr:hypothetical protein [Actinomycetota bacterium]